MDIYYDLKTRWGVHPEIVDPHQPIVPVTDPDEDDDDDDDEDEDDDDDDDDEDEDDDD